MNDSIEERGDAPNLVVVLAGQSNMSGRGEMAEVVEGQTTTLPIWMLLGRGADAHWVRASEPLHREADGHEMRALSASPAKALAGVGPGMSFSKRLLELCAANGASGVRLGLIPTAVGGTGMRMWHAGGLLFNNMCEQSLAGLHACGEKRIGGVLFYQGETDSTEDAESRAYDENLKGFVEGVRGVLGDDTPIILCAVSGADARMPFKKAVRKAQMGLHETFDSIRCVETEDLELKVRPRPFPALELRWACCLG